MAPAAGTEPVWAVLGTDDCWAGTPSKTLWIVDSSYGGTLRVRGETLDGTAVARFRARGMGSTLELALDLDREKGVIPGGASPEEMALYSYHPSYILYPHPGCWRLTAELGGYEVEIVDRRVAC